MFSLSFSIPSQCLDKGVSPAHFLCQSSILLFLLWGDFIPSLPVIGAKVHDLTGCVLGPILGIFFCLAHKDNHFPSLSLIPSLQMQPQHRSPLLSHGQETPDFKGDHLTASCPPTFPQGTRSLPSPFLGVPPFYMVLVQGQRAYSMFF